MPKVDRLLTLLQMLHNRSYVTIESIQEVFGVSERTAFRYIGSLRDAGIPVYNAYCNGGYRLKAGDNLKTKFTQSESVLLFLASVLAEDVVGQESLETLRSARAKLEATVSLAVREALDLGEQILGKPGLQGEGRRSLLVTLLLIAGVAKEPVQVTYDNGNSRPERRTINKPAVGFNNQYMLSDAADTSEGAIPLDAIRDVQFASPS